MGGIKKHLIYLRQCQVVVNLYGHFLGFYFKRKGCKIGQGTGRIRWTDGKNFGGNSGIPLAVIG